MSSSGVRSEQLLLYVTSTQCVKAFNKFTLILIPKFKRNIKTPTGMIKKKICVCDWLVLCVLSFFCYTLCEVPIYTYLHDYIRNKKVLKNILTQPDKFMLDQKLPTHLHKIVNIRRYTRRNTFIRTQREIIKISYIYDRVGNEY